MYNGHDDVVKLLLDYSGINGIDLNAANNIGWTRFTLACMKGHQDVVKLLLYYSGTKHIDLNAADNNGRNGLIMACSNGHKDVVKHLLDDANANGVCSRIKKTRVF